MSMDKLASKYISSAKRVFNQIEVAEPPIPLDSPRIFNVIDFAKAYLKDAEYYREKKKFEVSLSSVAYCEGLLDALKLLGAVRFEWPMRKEKRGRSGK